MSNPEHHCARPGLLGICYGLVSPSKQWRLDSCSPGLLLTLQGRRGRDSPSQLGESLLSVDPAGGEEDLPVRAWRGVGTLRCRGPAAGQQSVLSSCEVGGGLCALPSGCPSACLCLHPHTSLCVDPGFCVHRCTRPRMCRNPGVRGVTCDVLGRPL